MSLGARIPSTIWAALYIVAVLTMATVGYQAGVVGRCRSLVGVAFVLCFAVIMVLIADLDRPREGLVRVSSASPSTCERYEVEIPP
jgi:hypothetical protein